MNRILFGLFLIALAALLHQLNVAYAQPADPRYCGAPARDEDGRIHRSEAAKRAFAKLYACPATGKHSASCPGWAIDHVVPLACGGCDSPANMQWLPNEIKRCADDACKDRWERTVYQTSIPCQ